jgi:hypothetical protein
MGTDLPTNDPTGSGFATLIVAEKKVDRIFCIKKGTLFTISDERHFFSKFL